MPSSEVLVTVAQFSDGSLAELSRATLESAGIDAWVTDEHASVMYHGGAIQQRLQVRASDAAEAVKLLEMDDLVEPDFPPEISGPKCPSCGSGRTQTFLEEEDGSGFHLSDRSRRWMLACSECAHEWPDE